jgi:ESS family glutamate:Na+ symporter
MIYGLVYLTLVFLEGYLFPEMGDLGETFAGVFHGFNFLLGIVYALIFGKILSTLEAKGKNVNFMTNNYVLSNISSIAFNFLITAAVLMITVDALTHYAAFIVVLALFGAGSTFIFIKIIVKKVYGPEYEIEYFLGLFGMLTGTASTGLALLKGIDEDFKTPVAEEMVLGSGTAIALALPLFALLMFPGLAIDTGNNFYNVLVFLVPGVYFFILLAITLFINRKK